MTWMFSLLIAAAMLLSFSVSARAQVAAASGPRCVSASDMTRIAADFTQFAPLSGRQICDDGSEGWRILAALMFLREIRFESSERSRDELFSGRFAGNWYEYFARRINYLELLPECRKNVGAYVRIGGDPTMYICPMALTDQISAVDLAGIMMHEARHMDGFPHIDCTRGPRRQLPGACDERISDGGSYAVTVETYAQIARYATGLHPAQRAYARAAAVYFADEAFEHPVRVARKSQWLLLTSLLDLYLFDAKSGELSEAGRVHTFGKIIRRGIHMILFPEDRNQPAEFVFGNGAGRLVQSPPEFVKDYNAQTPSQRAELVDLHLATQWHARVYRNRVTMGCDPLSESTVDVNLPDGQRAKVLIYPEGYRRDANNVHLLTESSEVVELRCEGGRATARKIRLRFDRDYSRIENGAGDVLGIAEQKLYRIEGRRSRELRTGLEGTVMDMVPYDTFEFLDAD